MWWVDDALVRTLFTVWGKLEKATFSRAEAVSTRAHRLSNWAWTGFQSSQSPQFLLSWLPCAWTTCIWVFAFSVQAETSLGAQTVKRLSTMRETRVRFLGWEDPLQKEMAIHSSTIAWKIPWTEEPGRLQSMGSQRVGHDWATSRSCSSKLN